MDVARNITRWCDSTAEGNSMASRMAALIDPADRQGPRRRDNRAGPMHLTVPSALSAPDVSVIANLSDYPAAITHASYDGGDVFDAGASAPARSGPSA